jgi:hypothetical protein
MSHLRKAMMGAAGVSVEPVTVSYTDDDWQSTGATTSHTLSGAAIGSAEAGRIIVVGAGSYGQQDRTITGVTVGGVSAVSVAGYTTSPSFPFITELFTAVVPTGTTADIVVTWSGINYVCAFGVWAVYGASSTVHDTIATTGDPDPMTGTIDCPAGGAIVGWAYSGGANCTHTWVGVTESFDNNPSASQNHTGASDAFATTQSGLTVSCTPTNSPSSTGMVVASFEPA